MVTESLSTRSARPSVGSKSRKPRQQRLPRSRERRAGVRCATPRRRLRQLPPRRRTSRPDPRGVRRLHLQPAGGHPESKEKRSGAPGRTRTCNPLLRSLESGKSAKNGGFRYEIASRYHPQRVVAAVCYRRGGDHAISLNLPSISLSFAGGFYHRAVGLYDQRGHTWKTGEGNRGQDAQHSPDDRLALPQGPVGVSSRLSSG
jgi:hypothetical protein